MARLRKTEAQRRASRFEALYRIGKARTGFTDDQVAAMLGIGSRSTLLSYRKDPGKFGLERFAKLGAAFGWTDSDYMSILQPGRQ